MRALAQAFLTGLESGTPDVGLLARLGTPEPEKAARSIRGAASHPDLAPSAGEWLPALLATARPGFAAQTLEELAERHRRTRQRPLEITEMPALPRVLGSSDFLARLLLRHPHWTEELRGAPPGPPPGTPVEPDWTSIRIAKYRGLLRIAGRELLGRAFEGSLTELSELADRCLRAAIQCSAAETGIEPPALLTLGKLGGFELNFSSDVDLLFLDAQYPQGDRSQATARFVKHFKNHLEAPSEDGFGYRVDLDLRPAGKQGPLVNSVEAALEYYETWGADWERQMLIRLRPLDPHGAGADFAARIEPFVYRRLIDPGAIRAVEQMKIRIEKERRQAGLDLEVDLKEGRGGIRDVEFLIQALQLLHGGRHPEIRTGNVLETLAAFLRLDLLPRQAVHRLRDSYLWLRKAEHCLQMIEERQVRHFPRHPAAQLGLARRMGYDEVDGELARERLIENWTSVRTEVRAQFNKLVLESEPAESLAPILERHLQGTPLLQRFSLLAEPFLRRHVASERPQELKEDAARGLARVLASHVDMGRYLAHRPALVERIATATPDALGARRRAIELQPRAPEAEDLEEFLNQLRLFRRDETAWAAALDLGDQMPFAAISSYLSIVAEACVRWALAMAGVQLGLDTPPPLSVVGMGLVAGREMTYHSDLDLVFLYPDGAAGGVEPSRIAQRLIAYLTTMTGAGVAYEIDSRLRPSGRQGALVSTFSAFQHYQAERAALWEHLALMRSRVIAGQTEAAQRLLKAAQRSALGGGRSAWPEVAAMRRRVEQERGQELDGEGAMALKTGRGGLMDVEFLASGGLVERGEPVPEGQLPSIPVMLRTSVAGKRVEALLTDYALLRRLVARSRLVTGRKVERVSLRGEAAQRIAELMEPGLSPDRLGEQVEAARRSIRSAFTAVTEAGTIRALED